MCGWFVATCAVFPVHFAAIVAAGVYGHFRRPCASVCGPRNPTTSLVKRVLRGGQEGVRRG
eukprot:8311133-Pyramimonas_sp.AAC.1